MAIEEKAESCKVFMFHETLAPRGEEFMSNKLPGEEEGWVKSPLEFATPLHTANGAANSAKGKRVDDAAQLRAELKQVKAERDTAQATIAEQKAQLEVLTAPNVKTPNVKGGKGK